MQQFEQGEQREIERERERKESTPSLSLSPMAENTVLGLMMTATVNRKSPRRGLRLYEPAPTVGILCSSGKCAMKLAFHSQCLDTLEAKHAPQIKVHLLKLFDVIYVCIIKHSNQSCLKYSQSFTCGGLYLKIHLEFFF